MNYRNLSTGHIISRDNWLKLSEHNRGKYTPTDESETHEVEESESSDLISSLISSAVSDELSDNNSSGSFSGDSGSQSDSGGSVDFGGGSGEGAGASGGW